MPARSVCLVTLSPPEAAPGRLGRQISETDIYHTIPYHTIPYHTICWHCLCVTLKEHEDDDAAILHHTCIHKFFYLRMLAFG